MKMKLSRNKMEINFGADKQEVGECQRAQIERHVKLCQSRRAKQI